MAMIKRFFKFFFKLLKIRGGKRFFEVGYLYISAQLYTCHWYTAIVQRDTAPHPGVLAVRRTTPHPDIFVVVNPKFNIEVHRLDLAAASPFVSRATAAMQLLVNLDPPMLGFGHAVQSFLTLSSHTLSLLIHSSSNHSLLSETTIAAASRAYAMEKLPTLSNMAQLKIMRLVKVTTTPCTAPFSTFCICK